ncbi:MAG: DUF5063 domain-containing protein [Deltaproteobacteria bacterium]|nr:DUF5063 domain-containing protein [Deltaproteobacteria bacterium]
MKNEEVASFYETASQFLSFVTKNEITHLSVNHLMTMLMKLYIEGLSLPDYPDIEIETDDAHMTSVMPSITISKELPNLYWQIYYPFNENDLVGGALYDDIMDIVWDLLSGMEEYNKGRIGNAVFSWRFGLDNHWGQHAVDAIRVLHALRT